jgi:hypothetical protein
VVDLITTLSQLPSCIPLLQERLLPLLHRILHSNLVATTNTSGSSNAVSEYASGVVESAVELFGVVLHESSLESIGALGATLVPLLQALLQVLLISQDDSVVCQGVDTLQTLVTRIEPATLLLSAAPEASAGTATDGVPLLMQIIARLLQNDASPLAVCDVGYLLARIYASPVCAAVGAEQFVLQAVARAVYLLRMTRFDDLTRSLLFFLARIGASLPEYLVNCLAAAPIAPDNATMSCSSWSAGPIDNVTAFMNIWLGNQPFGPADSFKRKVNCIALCRMMQAAPTNQPLASVMIDLEEGSAPWVNVAAEILLMEYVDLLEPSQSAVGHSKPYGAADDDDSDEYAFVDENEGQDDDDQDDDDDDSNNGRQSSNAFLGSIARSSALSLEEMLELGQEEEDYRDPETDELSQIGLLV